MAYHWGKVSFQFLPPGVNFINIKFMQLTATSKYAGSFWKHCIGAYIQWQRYHLFCLGYECAHKTSMNLRSIRRSAGVCFSTFMRQSNKSTTTKSIPNIGTNLNSTFHFLFSFKNLATSNPSNILIYNVAL